jgi:hypothetical protein
MTRWVTAALALTLACAVPAATADEVKKPPVGTWTKKEGDRTVTFQIKADGMRVVLKGEGDQKIEVDADYGVTKDGVLFGRISKVAKPGGEGPEEGELFSFRFKVEKDKLILSDLTGTKIDDGAKKLVEGDYEKEKKGF